MGEEIDAFELTEESSRITCPEVGDARPFDGVDK